MIYLSENVANRTPSLNSTHLFGNLLLCLRTELTKFFFLGSIFPAQVDTLKGSQGGWL